MAMSFFLHVCRLYPSIKQSPNYHLFLMSFTSISQSISLCLGQWFASVLISHSSISVALLLKLSHYVAIYLSSEEEIKKMDYILGSTERVCYPSF
jgi:hypothetical protein